MTEIGKLAFAICLVVSDCKLPDMPTANVLGVQLTAEGTAEPRFAMTLCVTNPNPDALVFRQVTITLDQGGAPLASGLSDAPIRLGPSSSTRVPVSVVTKIRSLGARLLVSLKARSVDYRVYGSVALDDALGLGVPYSRSGRLGVASSSPGAAPSRCLASDIAVSL